MSINPEKIPIANNNIKVPQIYHNLNPNHQKVNIEIVNNEGIHCLDFLGINREDHSNSSQWKSSSLFSLRMVILIISVYGLFNQYSLICCSNTGSTQSPLLHGNQQNPSHLHHTTNRNNSFWEFMENYENLKTNLKNNFSTMLIEEN